MNLGLLFTILLFSKNIRHSISKMQDKQATFRRP